MTFDINPQHEWLIGIDSDGCVFDTMELKHKECFIPNIVNHYQLQGISKYVREAAEFVNLYSKDRGINRFPGLVVTFDLLARRPEVKSRGYSERVEAPHALRKWVNKETKLANPTLQQLVQKTGDADLAQALQWSTAVNESIAGMVRGVPPFPFVRESLERLVSLADMIVCSGTPHAALQSEWKEHDIDGYVVAICGQEAGSKRETLANAKRYAAHHSLMIGDAPGDCRAAQANGCLFFPINPGHEEDSWERFFREGIDRFLSGTFAGDYQQSLLNEFDRYLPEKPPWNDA